MINYARELDLPFSPAEAAWAAEVLRAVGKASHQEVEHPRGP